MQILVLDVMGTKFNLTESQGKQWLGSTKAMLTIDIILNWLVTILIIWRIWRVANRARAISSHQRNRYLSVILALVESGMLFSLTIGVYAVLWYINLVSDLMLSFPIR